LSEPAPVVVVHGLWMGAWQMRPLKNALMRHGRRVYRIHYPSTLRAFKRNQDALTQLVEQRIGRPCDFVAHSLGGLLVLDLLKDHPELCAGRVICLGTPINGSQVIRRLQTTPLRPALGHANQALLTGAAAPSEGIRVSMLAGTRSLGVGRVVTSFDEANDGSVGVSETHAPWLDHHECLALTHSQLVLAASAQRRVIALLG